MERAGRKSDRRRSAVSRDPALEKQAGILFTAGACVGQAEPRRKCAKGDDPNVIEVTLNGRIGVMVFGVSKTSDCKLTNVHLGKKSTRLLQPGHTPGNFALRAALPAKR